LWQVLQEIGVPATFKAMWVECAPAMFGYAAPAGAPPFGGPAWQEVQFVAVSGDPAAWHVPQAGPTFVDGAERSWQALQLAGNVAAVTVKWELSLYGIGCGAPPAPWHRVLLKQSGGVPAGAGVGGWPAGLFGDPGKWHCAQTAAFAVSVLVWL
jgi:hypothetical protein